MARVVIDSKHYHSNTELLVDGQTLVDIGKPCYSHLWKVPEGTERLWVWFPRLDDRHAGYISWLLNYEPLWADCFVTKNYEEGMEEGFEINLNQPTNWVFSALAAIRYPFEQEQGGWGYGNDFIWEDCRLRGFTELESLYLSNQFVLERGLLRKNPYNSNHIPMPRYLTFSKYDGKYFTKQSGLMIECSSCKGVTGSWDAGSYADIDPLVRHFLGRTFSPETADKLKETLRKGQ